MRKAGDPAGEVIPTPGWWRQILGQQLRRQQPSQEPERSPVVTSLLLVTGFYFQKTVGKLLPSQGANQESRRLNEAQKQGSCSVAGKKMSRGGPG